MNDVPVLYGDEEVAILLRRAIELERALPGPGDRTGFTLAELRQIGAEVGIPADVVDEAAGLVGMEKSGLWERIIRTPTRFFDQRTIKGELTAEQVAGLIAALRRLTRRQGQVEEVLGAVEWKTDSEFAPLHVRIHAGGGRTRIEALENRRSESGFALGVVGPFGGGLLGVIAAALAGLGPGLGSAGIVVGAVGVTSALVWRWWRRAAAAAGRRMDHLMIHLGAEASRLAQHGQTSPAHTSTEPVSERKGTLGEP